MGAHRTRRTSFSPYAVVVLATAFSISPSPTKQQREKLAKAIGTTERRVQVWFQNRRQRAASTVQTVPRPRADATETNKMDDASSKPHHPYPVSATYDNEYDEAIVARPAAPVPYDARRLREGLVKANMCMEAFISSSSPFQVMWASSDWGDFCGFENAEVVGQTLHVLHGPETDIDTIVALMDAISRLDSINLQLTSYTRHGIPFRHKILAEPLRNSRGETALYRISSRDVASLTEQGMVEGSIQSAPNTPPLSFFTVPFVRLAELKDVPALADASTAFLE